LRLLLPSLSKLECRVFTLSADRCCCLVTLGFGAAAGGFLCEVSGFLGSCAVLWWRPVLLGLGDRADLPFLGRSLQKKTIIKTTTVAAFFFKGPAPSVADPVHIGPDPTY